jgi:ribonucleoside-triphosphate reductase
LQVIKRNGTLVEFDAKKVETAILKAMKYGSGLVDEHVARDIANEIAALNVDTISIQLIEALVFKELVRRGHDATARSYEGYRAVQEFKRKHNTTDSGVLGLLDATNDEVMRENSNKDAVLASTQRDLVAGEVSKDITDRFLLPSHLVQAHKDGVLHFHDRDYFMQPIFNCCLINIKDMFDKGTVINKRMIETPKGFQVACTVMTQIIAQVASNQYGGQSIAVKHLGKYLKLSEEKYYRMLKDVITDIDELNKAVEVLLAKELRSGVQTIQYQINTLMTTNGQSPFVTMFLELDEQDEYLEYTARIIEEILKQRIEGIKNEKGVYTTPAFPKLIYVLDEHNNLTGGRFDYITHVAAQCSAKRMYPDYISAKVMRAQHNGNVFSSMGCRSFLSDWQDENGNYQYEGRFNMGVVSINLPQIGIIAQGDMDKFWKMFDQRLELCFEALMCRYKHLKGVRSDVSPIHWQYGAIARLEKGETIDKLLDSGYATISLGYIGLYELTYLMLGESNTTERGQEFALEVIKHLKRTCDRWKQETGLGFGLYGTPSEGLCDRFCKVDKAQFGEIENVTDKGWYTNSFHVDVREEIDAFSKLAYEAPFQIVSSGGCISYIEIPNLNHNVEAIESVIKFIYDNIQYAEFNTKSDYCMECGFDGEIIVNDDYEWECPNCHNKDQSKMNVVRRTCGYLGENFWNEGKTKEIKDRVIHLN